MEQLGRHEIASLVRQTKGLFAPRPVGEVLWTKARKAGQEGLGSAACVSDINTSLSAAGDAALPMMGLERRLARRAEALWDNLRTDGGLPQLASAAALLAPPFSDSAMLVLAPPPVPGHPAGSLQVEYVGQHLQKLAKLTPGRIVPDASADLAARLVALAERAMALGGPATLESEGMLADRVPSGSSPLLMRAIALPLADCDGAGSAAVVITSWRELLSVDETVALHRELAAAIDWMHAHKADD